jgi:transposase
VRRSYKLRAYPTRPPEGQAAQLKAIRAADPDGQGRHSFTAQQQTLRRLSAVFAAYLRRVRDARGKERRVGSPRFKPYQRFDQVLFVAGDGARWEPADGGRSAHASFQAVGRVKVNQHRPMVGRMKTLQLKREGRRWYVIVVSQTDPVPLPPTGREVGVDLGVARFLTTSDGAVVANPRFLDAGWGQFTSILVAKAASAGRRVALVDPAFTSVDCHACGARCARPRQDIVVCPVHGELDADLNGACDIATRAGLGSGQASAA